MLCIWAVLLLGLRSVESMAPKFFKSGASGTETKDGKTVCAKVQSGLARIEFTAESIASGILYCDATSRERARLTSDVLNELGGKYKNRTHCFKENTQEKQAEVFKWMKEQCAKAESINDQATSGLADRQVFPSRVTPHGNEGLMEPNSTESLIDTNKGEVCPAVVVQGGKGRVTLRFYDPGNIRSATVFCANDKMDKTVNLSSDPKNPLASPKCVTEFHKPKHQAILAAAHRMCDGSYNPPIADELIKTSLLASDPPSKVHSPNENIAILTSAIAGCPDVEGTGGHIKFDGSLVRGTLFCGGHPYKGLPTRDTLDELGYKDRTDCIKKPADAKHNKLIAWIGETCQKSQNELTAPTSNDVNVACPTEVIWNKDGNKVELRFLDVAKKRLATVFCNGIKTGEPFTLSDAGKETCANVSSDKHKGSRDAALSLCGHTEEQTQSKGLMGSVASTVSQRAGIAYNSVGSGCAKIVGFGGRIKFSEKSFQKGVLMCYGDPPDIGIPITEGFSKQSLDQKYEKRTECINNVSDKTKHKSIFDWIEAECGLIYQIRHQHLDVVKRLLDRGEYSEAVLKTALYHAVAARNIFTVRYLLGLDRDLKNLVLAQRNQKFHNSSGKQEYATLEGKSSLMIAASNNDQQILEQMMLKENPAVLPDALTEALESALSVSEGPANDAIMALLERGAKCKWSDIQQYVFRDNSVAVLSLHLLINLNAIEPHDQSTSLAKAREATRVSLMAQHECQDFQTPQSSYKQVLNFEDSETGYTPLMYAIISGCKDEHLLELIGDDNERLKPALSVAAEKGKTNLVVNLIKRGVDTSDIALTKFESRAVTQLLRAAVLKKNLELEQPNLRGVLLQFDMYGVPSSQGLQGEEEVLVDSFVQSAVDTASQRCFLSVLKMMAKAKGDEFSHPKHCTSPPCQATGGSAFGLMENGDTNLISVYCFSAPDQIYTFIEPTSKRSEGCTESIVKALEATEFCTGTPDDAFKAAMNEERYSDIPKMLEFKISDDNLRLALQDAVNKQKTDLVALLIPRVPPEDVNVELEEASVRGFADVVKSMLDSGFNFDASRLETSLQAAAERGDLAIIKALLQLKQKGKLRVLLYRFPDSVLQKAQDLSPEDTSDEIAKLFENYKAGQSKLSGFKELMKSSRSGSKKATDPSDKVANGQNSDSGPTTTANTRKAGIHSSERSSEKEPPTKEKTFASMMFSRDLRKKVSKMWTAVTGMPWKNRNQPSPQNPLTE